MKTRHCGWIASGLTLLLTLALALSGLEARTWTSATDAGKTLEGELVGSDGTTIEIKLATGKTIKAPLTAFSKADQEFVAAQGKPGSEPAKPEPGKPDAPAKPEDLEPAQFEIWKIRDCCSKAERMYEEAIRQVDGVKFEFDENSVGAKIIKVDAETKVAAREALAKIAEAGLYGETDSREVGFKSERNPAKGDMTATGVVLCCNKCADNLESALKRAKGAVDGEKGVTEHTMKKSSDTFEIKGTATATEVLRFARDAGINLKLEATPAEPE